MPDKTLRYATRTNILLGLLIVSATPFLFTDTLDLLQFRLTPFLWDLGHLLLFFAVGWLLLNWLNKPKKSKFISLFVGFNTIAFLLGWLIEEIQLAHGRDYSYLDIYRNCLGISLALLFHPDTPLTNRRMRVTFRTLSILPLLAALVPLTKNSMDWISARQSFPILSDLESTFERERWIGENLEIIELDSGNHVIAHRFDTARYSSISLTHFPSNWSDYNCLRYRIFNPTLDSLWLTIRIHDQSHAESGLGYSDRFNHRFEVVPGWNENTIDLSVVRNAPEARLMNMSEILEVMFFTVSLDESATLYFDDIELGGGPSLCEAGAKTPISN